MIAEEQKQQQQQQQPTKEHEVIKSVVFRRYIHANYATLDAILIVDNNNKDQEQQQHVKIFIYYGEVNTDRNQMRSDARRSCRIGDLIEVRGSWFHDEQRCVTKIDDNDDNNRDKAKRFDVRPKPSSSLNKEEGEEGKELITNYIKLIQCSFWEPHQCQAARNKFCVFASKKSAEKHEKNKLIKKKQMMNQDNNKNNEYKKQKKEESNPTNAVSTEEEGEERRDLVIHGANGDIGKRDRGTIVGNFFLSCMMKKKQNTLNEESYKTIDEKEISRETNEWLNQGSGVMDIAGGMGHVSLALGLIGIQSTVIDPRSAVGKLPKRDRKVLRKKFKEYERSIDDKNDVSANNSNTNDDDDGVNNINQIQQQPLPTPPPTTSITKATKTSQSFTTVQRIPPILFKSKRAWFAERPKGVDVRFRESSSVPSNNNKNSSMDCIGCDDTEEIEVPVCSLCSPDNLLSTCTAGKFPPMNVKKEVKE